MEKNKLTNNSFRNMMLKSIISDDIGQINEVDEGCLIHSFSKKLEQMKNSNDLFYGLYQGMITVAFLDTYKVLNAKLRDSNIGYLELQLYNKIREVDCIEDLEDLIESDTFIIEELLKYSLEFLRMNIFNKIISIKKLANNQKYSLRCTFPLFELDIEQYGFSKGVPMEIITDYYIAEKNKAEGNDKIEPAVKENQLVEEIEGFIKNLMANDYPSYASLMEEIITLDYRWSKYIIDKKYKLEAFDIDELNERVENFEDYTLHQLVEEASTEEYYFEKLIDSMLCIKYNNMYFDKDVLNEDIIEEYFRKNKSKKRKK